MDADAQFFYDHAGWSYDPASETSEQGRERCAEALANAEQVARVQGWTFAVEDDPEPVMEDDAGSVELVESGEYVNLMVTMYAENGDVLGSLGGIVVESEDDPYIRAVKATLADEAL
jgi:hypothetical protein